MVQWVKNLTTMTWVTVEVQVQSPAQEVPYNTGVVTKKKKKEKKKILEFPGGSEG